MVSLEIVRSSNAALVKSQPLVAVFIGATAGIGSYAAKALTGHAKDGKGLRLYIVGRNKTAAERIISECQKLCPKGQFRFIQADDLAILKNVDRICAEITSSEQKEVGPTGGKARIDLLVMTAAYLGFDGRKETQEGLDELMSLLYYSRIRFTTQLMPLLLESPLPAHVVSVFGPARDEKLFLDDISLRNPKHYGFMPMGSHVAYMKTFYMEYLAEKYTGKLALIHYFPGLVVTEAFQRDTLPKWFKLAWKCVVPFSRFFAVSTAECGERVIFLASKRFPARNSTPGLTSADGLEIATSSDGVVGGGAYRVDWDGELIPLKKNYKKLRADGWAEKFQAHTDRVLADIDAGKPFTG